MKKFLFVALYLAAPSEVHAASKSDLRDYAISSCLVTQKVSPALQSEGYRLADVVINRAGIDPFVWKPLANAVNAALARRGMLMVHVDAPVAQSTQPAPLASCLLVIDDAAVRTVMTKLESKKKR